VGPLLEPPPWGGLWPSGGPRLVSPHPSSALWPLWSGLEDDGVLGLGGRPLSDAPPPFWGLAGPPWGGLNPFLGVAPPLG
jgi:hypothetical protein